MADRSYTLEELRDYDRHDTDDMLDWAADEIERLGRCNEELNRSQAQIINKQNAEIERLRGEVSKLETRAMCEVGLREIAEAQHQLLSDELLAAHRQIQNAVDVLQPVIVPRHEGA